MDILGAFERTAQDWGGSLKAFLEEGYHPTQIEDAPLADEKTNFMFGPGGEFANRPAPKGYARDAKGWLRVLGDQPKLNPLERTAGYLVTSLANDPVSHGGKAAQIVSALGGPVDTASAGIWAGNKGQNANWFKNFPKAFDITESGLKDIRKKWNLRPFDTAKDLTNQFVKNDDGSDLWVWPKMRALRADIEKVQAQSMQETGLSKDIGTGRYLSEIDDSQAKIIKALTTQTEGEPLKAFYSHPELFQEYPQIGNYPVFLDPAPGYAGMFYRQHPRTGEPAFAFKGSEAETMLPHEIQHAVQNIEGLPRGGSAEMFMPPHADSQIAALQTLRNEIMRSPQFQKAMQNKEFGPESPVAEVVRLEKYMLSLSDQVKNAGERYWNLYGEGQARDSEVRRTLNKSERDARPPFTYGHAIRPNPFSMEIIYK